MASGGDSEELRIGPYVGAGEFVDGTPGEPDEWTAEPLAAVVPKQRPAPERPGPQVLEGDPWDEDPDEDSTNEAYHGRRRAQLPTGRPWLVAALIVVGLAVLVAIPLSLASLFGGGDGAGPATTATLAGPGEVLVPGPDSPTPTSSPSATPTAVPTTTSARTSAPRTTPRPPRTTTALAPPPPPLPFAPISIEAEAGGSAVTLGGSARVWNYDGASGGQIVRNVGDWNSSQGPGTVRFNAVSIPANGTYTVSIHFVHPDDEQNRSAVVNISGLDPINVSFTGGSNCCDVKVLTVALAAGTHTITIANSEDHAPSIDRVLLARV